MHIEVSGRGPALVLLHGWGLHGAVFEPLLAQLRDHFSVHCVDLPGHGLSHADSTALRLPQVVNAVAAATPPAVWCGWSLGGLFALHAAATLPKVRGLVMIASSPRFVRADDWQHAVPVSALEQLGDELGRDFPATLERFLALDLMGTDAASAGLAGLRQRLLAHGGPAPRALTEGLQLLRSTDLRAALPGLVRPSLWLAGQRDRLVPPAAMQAAAAMAPGSSMLSIAHGGHAPFLGHATQVAAALQQFVARLTPADEGQ